VKIRCGHLDTT